MKPKKCKQCGSEFEPKFNTTQRVCSPKCAVAIARNKITAVETKKLRKDTAERKKRLKTRSDWIKEAQKAVNAYVRARDRDRPCISCGKKADDRPNQWDAGHYRSVGSAPHLRFYTLNIAKQCVRCNRDLSGNTVDMRAGLIMRYGLFLVGNIEAMQEPLKPSVEYLERLIKIMRKKTKMRLSLK